MATMNYGTILPGVGIQDIMLGMCKDELLAIMGEPESRTTEDFPDGSSIDAFNYEALGLYFHFGSAFEHVLNAVRIWREDLLLFDCPLAGLSSEETLAVFQSNGEIPDPDVFSFTTDDGARIVSYDFDRLGLTVSFYDDLLTEVEIGPRWADEDTPIFPWKAPQMANL